MVRLRVPASTANLGPGFDCLGCALTLYMDCRFEASEALQITGCPAAHCGKDNLIYRACREASAALGLACEGLRLDVQSAIPFARGLGSSAAAIAAGVAAAYVMAGRGLDREGIFRLAAQMEGHPDNAAAAVFGGLRASLKTADRCWSVPYPLHDALRFTALIPGFELPTEQARAVLKPEVTRQDAIFNLSRVPLLLSALRDGDMTLLRVALEDRLHQQARLPLIQGGAAVWQAAEATGAAVFLSGAGPTLMCLNADGEGQQALVQAITAAFPGWQALPFSADIHGIQQL